MSQAAAIDMAPPAPVVSMAAMRGGPIACVLGNKGGIGKSQLAIELAAAWQAVLIDFDWDEGGVTRAFGFAPSTALLQALELGSPGKPPRPRSATARPDLVLSHPDLAVGGWKPEEVALRIEGWAAAWHRPVVIDTHPGIGELAHAALAAADIVLSPVPLLNAELNAAEAFVQKYGDGYPLLLVPTMVPPIPPARQLQRLREIAQAGNVPVAPPIGRYPWIGTRGRRSAVVLAPPSNRTERAQRDYLAVARHALELCRGRG